ncbi:MULTISPECIES: SHOCT domain-containing protein [Campylobacter]|uniref:SHOCT domain-containing protein n=2 Tax=Campylobacter TaxID=194 RepID=A0A4U7BH03_9BACT|nr:MULTISPECIES: SHOCT domain-containing protein [Campylobacter]EAL8918100.1 SHOCT domain-containing protein [Campylobacter jejuni]ECP9346075.1 SHOCT domain-containing protein [Campylobacter jejuni]ECZ5738690.1 SHOCT domain-containing protein [Campylobacter jejuni]EDO8477227.1 hypothetical protein [Campylobacter jejuni]EGK7546982.1 SHOCT domain-containing protein [Campylobacter jejuni]
MGFVGLAYFIISFIGAIEIARDAKQRNMSGLWWGIGAFLLGIFVWILYIAVKEPYKREQKMSKMRDLEFLRGLKEKGVISEAEYEKHKTEVLEWM